MRLLGFKKYAINGRQIRISWSVAVVVETECVCVCVCGLVGVVFW